MIFKHNQHRQSLKWYSKYTLFGIIYIKCTFFSHVDKVGETNVETRKHKTLSIFPFIVFIDYILMKNT